MSIPFHCSRFPTVKPKPLASRVPIVKMTTAWGFEGDLAIGGHNGTDTSAFASQQASRYASFAPVVLALKIILAQTKLDEPFCGGLGSYKIYVMVAYHLEQHLSIGGEDRPSEVLLMFWFRFCSENFQQTSGNRAFVTSISMETCLKTRDGAEADFSNVFLLDHVMQLFRLCWDRTMDLLDRHNNALSKKLFRGKSAIKGGNSDKRISYLVGCIDSAVLGKARGTASAAADKLAKQLMVGPYAKASKNGKSKKRKKEDESPTLPPGGRSAEALVSLARRALI